MLTTLEQDIATAALVAPPKPQDLQGTGLGVDTITSIILKVLHSGEATGMRVADAVALPYSILEPLVEKLRLEALVEVKSATGTGTAGYRYALTDAGRDRARRYFEACGYVGPAPVPLAQYTSYMAELRNQKHDVFRDRVAGGFSHLVVEPEMLDQLGPAIASRRAVFLYGPPGNGKSVMGEGIGHALGGDIYVPHAMDVDGQIIVMFDPVTHEARERDVEGSIIRSESAVDERWTRVRRPV